jgi:hypothetical protein
MHEDSGQTARWAHRQDAYVPIATNSPERPMNTACHPVAKAYRYRNEVPQLRFAPFGMTNNQNEIFR